MSAATKTPKTKICTKCEKRKRLERFDKAPGYKHGVNSRCKELLCNQCNHGLGKFGDNPEVLLAAYNYLMQRGSSGGVERA